MRIFEKDGHVNFVDDNNVLVGWDNIASCCESFSWDLDKSLTSEELEAYSFDIDYFEEGSEGSEYFDDCGGFVRFRATNPQGGEVFLTLSMLGGQGIIHYGSL